MNNTAILNIGLNIGEKRHAITEDRLYWALNSFDPVVLEVNIDLSGDEPTAIVRVMMNPGEEFGEQRAKTLAGMLEQEAVAVLERHNDGSERGYLAGPKAEAWGEFNPELFIMPSFNTLARERAQD